MSTTGDRTYELVLSLSNGNSVSAGTFTVPQGDKGDKGDKGDTGATGPQGPIRMPEIGEIYMSTNPTSPASLFGGTWEQIKDRFLLGAGDSYSAGATGGSATHTLTVNEMPRHNHMQQSSNWSYVFDQVYSYLEQEGTLTGIRNTEGYTEKGQYNIYTKNEGASNAHNNMPPYLAIYIWKRTA